MTERQLKITKFYDIAYNGSMKFSHGEDVVLKNKMDRLSDEDCKAMSTYKLSVFAAYIGRQIDSLYYGEIIGLFKTEDGEIYRFTHRVHKPNKKSALLSNRMTRIEKIVKSDISEIGYKTADTTFGYKAFWDNCSVKEFEQSGDKDAAALKDLMCTITAYSRKNNYIRYFRNIERRKQSQCFIEAQSAI